MGRTPYHRTRAVIEGKAFHAGEGDKGRTFILADHAETGQTDDRILECRRQMSAKHSAVGACDQLSFNCVVLVQDSGVAQILWSHFVYVQDVGILED